MKYLQHILLHIGLCLLLASANLASAQTLVTLNLENPQTNGLTIQFTISLTSPLAKNQQLGVLIRIAGVSGSEISNFNVITNNNDCPNGNFMLIPNFTPPRYQICMNSGARSVRVQFRVNNPETSKTITVTLVSVGNSGFPGGLTTMFNPRSLDFTVNPAILVRSKVFLEGPLQ